MLPQEKPGIDEWQCLLGLFALGLLIHSLWAIAAPMPTDWDAQYYLTVGQQIASGNGAVNIGLWNLSYLPNMLPAPADLYWMPLPSRIIVPGLLIWPEHGDQLITVILAAFWAPLAYLLCRLHSTRNVALVAGGLIAFGGVYAPYLSTPDSFAIYGVLGGIALYATARSWWVPVVITVFLAALTRNDGFFLGLCMAVGFRGWRAGAIAGAGLLATALWTIRNYLIGGADYFSSRLIATSTTDYVDLYDGVISSPVSLIDRFTYIFTSGMDLLEFWFTPGLILLSPFTLWATWNLRNEGWVRAFALFALVVPIVSIILAPAVVNHGTLYRSAAAVMVAHVTLGVIGLFRFTEFAHKRRDYPIWFLPSLIGCGYLISSIGIGVKHVQEAVQVNPCTFIAGHQSQAPIFTSQPLALELNCGVAGIMITDRMDPERAMTIASQYGVELAIATELQDEGSASAEDLRRILPDWEEIEDGLFQRQ